MKKYLANIVSSSRIVGSIILFCCNDFTHLYLGVYVFCGFTDLIDGPIARKTKSSSVLGAALDTIGDVFTYLSLLKILILKRLIPGWVLIWLSIMIVLFFGLAFFAKHKFNKFYLLHTYIGKMLGSAVFVLPIAMQIIDGEIWMAVICSILTIHFFEATYIQIKNKTAKDFVPTIFQADK